MLSRIKPPVHLNDPNRCDVGLSFEATALLRGELLPLRRVEELEVGLRHRARPVAVDVPVDHGDGRLGENRE